nr:MAG TPA: hypothetical protein [Caudoviricetes sp.]
MVSLFLVTFCCFELNFVIFLLFGAPSGLYSASSLWYFIRARYRVLCFAHNILREGVINVATKSILKTVHIKDNTSARRLANALSNAYDVQHQPVVFKCRVSDASDEEIRAMFGDNK